MRGDRVISLYKYLRCGESSENVGCSIGLEREQPSMKVVTVKFEGAHEGLGENQLCSGAWVSFNEQKDFQGRLFFILACIGLEVNL